MKYFLPSVIGAATVALVQPHVTFAQNTVQPDVKDMAQKITVKIFTANDPGSGVIIGKNGNKYYVLTARHVVNGVENESGYLKTHDGQEHDIIVDHTNYLPNNIDLALVQFESDRDYPVATISDYNYRLYERRDYDYGTVSDASKRQYVFVSGMPLEQDKWVFNPGFLFDNSATAVSKPDVTNPDPNDDFGGYELVYTNLTHPGISGGAVLDTEGRLIGIHGRSDGRKIGEEDEIIKQYLDEVGGDPVRIKVGLSLGIPIQSFLSWAKEQPVNNYLAVESSAPPELESTNVESWLPPISVTDKTNPYHWLEKGNQLWRIGQTSQARGAYTIATDLKEDLYLAWFARGFVYGFDRQYQEALNACDRAIELNVFPNKVKYESHRCKAGALQQLQRPQEALTALNKALSINNRNPADSMLQGELYFALGKYETALTSLDRAVELRQSQNLAPSPLFHNNRALVKLELKKYESALEDVETAISLDPQFAPAWRNKGLILETIGRDRESVAAYDRSLELEPEDYNTWTNRGFALYKLQQYQQAKQSFEKALKVNPQYQPAIDNLKAINSAI